MFKKLSNIAAVMFNIYIVFTLAANIIIDNKINSNSSTNSLEITNISIYIYSLLILALIVGIVVYIRKKQLKPTSDKLFFALITTANVFFLFVQLFVADNIWFMTDWDVGTIVNNAVNIARTGENVITDIWYFNKCPNNLTLLYILVAILKYIGPLFEQQYFSLVRVSVVMVWMAVYLTVLCIYRITANKTITVAGMILSWLLIGLSPWIVIPYSDSMGIVFPILAVFCYLYIGNVYVRFFAVSLTCFMGYLIKPPIVIVLIAMVLITGCDMLQEMLDKKFSIKKATGILLAVVLALALYIPAKNIVYEIDESPLDANRAFTATHYFMMGLNYQYDGVWCGDDVLYSESFATVAERQAANLSLAKDRLKYMGIKGYANLLLIKNMRTYNDGTFNWSREGIFYYQMQEQFTPAGELLTSYYYEYGENFRKYAVFAQILWLITLTGCCLCLSFNKSDSENLISITLLGVSMYILLFECRARYLFIFLPLYVIMCIIGVTRISDKISKK